VPSGRGVAVLAAALGLWLVARIAGSPTLHIVAVGLAVLPIAAVAYTRWSRQRLRVRRRPSDQRIQPGRRVTVELEIENESSASTSFLLLEDAVPAGLGRPARLVLTGIAAHGLARASYSLVAQSRGRYALGPLAIDVSDPFALTRSRVEFAGRDELIVTPAVEELETGPESPFGQTSGLSLAKHLFRTGEEFFTMRAYQEGDDLRRIHWPSVARSGELMIRQDESTRRSTAVMYLDTRQSVVGQTRSAAFERCVSSAASIGMLLARHGFTIRLATTRLAPSVVSGDEFLDTLAAVSHDGARSAGPALGRLRSAASTETTFVAVTAPPDPGDLAALVRLGSAFGAKLAVLVYPVDPATLSPDRQSQIEGRASSARLSLSRSGWEVLVLAPGTSLREVWQRNRTPLPALSG
jgi:uncharacterized protein (DUF58 family)